MGVDLSVPTEGFRSSGSGGGDPVVGLGCPQGRCGVAAFETSSGHGSRACPNRCRSYSGSRSGSPTGVPWVVGTTVSQGCCGSPAQQCWGPSRDPIFSGGLYQNRLTASSPSGREIEVRAGVQE